jgi:hypothetical protein
MHCYKNIAQNKAIKPIAWRVHTDGAFFYHFVAYLTIIASLINVLVTASTLYVLTYSILTARRRRYCCYPSFTTVNDKLRHRRV